MRRSTYLNERMNVAVATMASVSTGALGFVLLGGAGPTTGGSCFEGTNTFACNLYNDSTPTCPDIFLGGSFCNKAETSVIGQQETTSVAVSCLVLISIPNPEGEGCVTGGVFNAQLQCVTPAGDRCIG